MFLAQSLYSSVWFGLESVAEIAVGRTEVPFSVFVLNSSGPRVSGRSSRRWGGSTQRLYGGRRRGTERTGCWDCPKLQALVYDILLSTTAIGSRKLSANEQFCWCSNSSKFVTFNLPCVHPRVVRYKMISDVCFITDHVAYAISNKTNIV